MARHSRSRSPGMQVKFRERPRLRALPAFHRFHKGFLMNKYAVTRKSVERLYTWVKAHCPCALEEPDFMRGLILIADEAVKDAVQNERKRIHAQLLSPSQQ
jgi:hypothetical protein